MTGTAVRLHAPTLGERLLLAIAARLTVHVQRRVQRRDRQHELLLRMLQDRQTQRADPRALAHLLAQAGAPEH